MESTDPFAAPATPAADAGPSFVVDLDGYEGPIDMLLSLARDQKVDLTQISMVQLADQYLAFIAEADRADIDVAADYLVMAAWLAYMKSRLLLPELGGDDEPSGEALAAALAFQLQRLEAMQESGVRLMASPRLGQDFFARGDPEIFAQTASTVIDLSLFELLRAYGEQRRRTGHSALTIEPREVFTVEDALNRIRGLLGAGTDWQDLWRFLPTGLGEGLLSRSAYASTLAASLELAREGKLTLRQEAAYGPIYVRPGRAAAPAAAEDDDGGDGA